jgi:hypothetical protein
MIMFTRIRKKLNRDRFYRLTRGILDTPPMPVKDANWSIVSMVSNDDVQMYLLAMKSFYARMERGKLIVIVDRDMPNELRGVLQRHFPGIRFVILEDIDTGICQRGGTWERLVYLLDHAENEYAIQVDCDTLTFGEDVDEVISCAENNVAFTLSNIARPIKSMLEASAEAYTTDSNYVGIVAERLFEKYPDAANTKYVRGSSGFAGFAKGAFSRKQIEEFHRNMENLLGQDWKKWGTEQCASNFAVANSPGAIPLPHPKYETYWPGFDQPNTFLHFIGSHRYDNDYFAKRGQDVIRELNARKATRVA